jgi:hypothetical protein
LRGGEADEAIHGAAQAPDGLLRCARNDGVEGKAVRMPPPPPNSLSRLGAPVDSGAAAD